MILHGIEYQRPTSLNMRILADHVTYSVKHIPTKQEICILTLMHGKANS